jgi:hypothetical protein
MQLCHMQCSCYSMLFYAVIVILLLFYYILYSILFTFYYILLRFYLNLSYSIDSILLHSILFPFHSYMLFYPTLFLFYP